MDNEFEHELEQDKDAALTSAEIDPPATPEKRRGVSKLLAGVIAGVLVLALVIGLAGKALAGGSVMERSVKGLQANPTLAFLSDLAQSGTVSMELGLKQLLGVDGAVTVEWKNDYSDAKAPRAAMDLGLALNGKQIVDAGLYADMERLILSSDALLPKQGLGLDLKNLSENLDKSVFHPDSGSDYALDPEVYDLLKQMLSTEEKPDMAQQQKQGEAVYESLVKTLYKSVKTHAEQTKTNDTLSFGDREVKVKVQSFAFDAQGVYGIALDILTWAKDSQDLRDLLDATAKSYATLPEFDETTFDPDSFYTQLDEVYTQLQDGREDFLAENEDLTLEVDLYVSRGKGELLGLKLQTEQQGETVEAEAFWGPSLAEMNDIRFQYSDGYNKYSGSYTVTANDKNTFSSVLKLRENAHTVFEGSFRWDKADGDFALELDDDTSVKGTLEALADGYRAEIHKVTAYGDTQELDLRLELRNGAKFDALPAYQELTAMSEADMEKLVDDLEDAAYGLLWNRDVLGLVSGLVGNNW